jgi:ABC-type sugar transport system ATPase subunit
MRGELKHLQKVLNHTMIYVTHDQLEAMSMADRIAIMNLGILQQLGTPDEIFNQPVNQFVAGFVGDPPMNFIDCTLEVTGDNCQLVNDSFRIIMPPELIAKFKEKSSGPSSGPIEVVLGVRPENFIITNEKGNEESFPGEIYVTEPLGEDMIVDVTIPKNKLKLKTSVDLDIRMGDKVWLEAMKNKIHLFNRKTQQAYF